MAYVCGCERKETKSTFDGYVALNSVLIISHTVETLVSDHFGNSKKWS